MTRLPTVYCSFSDGTVQPAAYTSRTLTAAENGCILLENDALALRFREKTLQAYLYGPKFNLVMDHKPLYTIFGPKRGMPTLTAARMQRWTVRLSAFNYTLVFKWSSENAGEDYFSQLPVNSVEKR